MEEEIFKDIVGYEGLYQISDKGTVLSTLPKRKPKVLAISIKGNGYIQYGLFKNGIRSYKGVHRLIAEAFIPNPENKSMVDHINNLPEDNRIENLRWVTLRENQQNQLRNKKGNTSSKYVGVHWNKSAGKFSAGIKVNGKNKHLGSFVDEEEAAVAYDDALIDIGLEPVNFKKVA
jgi:hypothetical protein